MCFAFFMGVITGSFLNFFISRILIRESFDNDILQYVCYNYKLSIFSLFYLIISSNSWDRDKDKLYNVLTRYFTFEIIHGLIYIILYIKFGLDLEFFFMAIFLSILSIISYIDFKTKYVFSFTINIARLMGGIFILYRWIYSGSFPIDNLLGSLFGFIIMFLIVKITNGMGEGDIDVLSVCGLFLGTVGVFITIFFAIVICGILGLFIILFNSKYRNFRIPFVPFLEIASFIVVLWGNNIINIYTNYLLYY